MKATIQEQNSSQGEREGIERSSSHSWFWLLLLGILLLASVLRLYALDIYPQSMDHDEMVLGYDAWSLWTTGHDQHGEWFPVYFRSFGDYVPPVAYYIVAPFVGIFGLSEESTRFPFALMGIATVFFVALLGRRWFNSGGGLLAALLLTIDPWHINYSRVALPASCLPFFTVVGLYCFTRGTSLFATKKHRRLRTLLWLAGSALSFALLTGSYSIMKLEGPLLLCACAFAVLPFVRKFSHVGWRDFFLWFVLYGLFVSPLALAQFHHWDLVQGRFNEISILNQPHWLSLFFTQYANSYNPSMLFFTGVGSSLSLQVLPQGVGQLFWLEWPLWIFAVIGMSQQRHISRQVGFVVPALLAIWFVTFPIAACLTGNPHELRTYNVVPLPEILAGYGAVVAWEMLQPYRWKCFSVVQTALETSIIVFLIFNWMFLSFFFSPPLLQTDATADQIPYNVGLRPVLTTVMQQVQPCDTVWLESTNQTYIYFLFLTRYPSSLFQSTRQEVDAFQNLYGSVGQMHVGTPDTQGSAVSLPAGCEGMPSRTFFITRKAQIQSGWQQVMAVSNRAGVPIWQALVKT